MCFGSVALFQVFSSSAEGLYFQSCCAKPTTLSPRRLHQKGCRCDLVGFSLKRGTAAWGTRDPFGDGGGQERVEKVIHALNEVKTL